MGLLLPDAQNTFANRIVFEGQDAVNVASGFGYVSGNTLVEGFIRENDFIEIEGSNALFLIGDFTTPTLADGSGRIIVPFSNSENAAFAVGAARSMLPDQLPLTTTGNHRRRFKIYRQPTKSLVGMVSLPRGTCVDLSQSGLGSQDSGANAGYFAYQDAAASTNASPSDFGRIGVVFDSHGRLAYLVDEHSLRVDAGNNNRPVDLRWHRRCSI